MPEPSTVLLGAAALLLALALVSLSRFMRLRRHIDESASAVAAERRRRDRLVSTLRDSGMSSAEAEGPAPQEPPEQPGLSEQVEEAEDRLAAVNRLYSAQIRAWNRLGHGSLWGRLRRLTGWQPMPEPPAEAPRRAVTRDDEPA